MNQLANLPAFLVRPGDTIADRVVIANMIRIHTRRLHDFDTGERRTVYVLGESRVTLSNNYVLRFPDPGERVRVREEFNLASELCAN